MNSKNHSARSNEQDKSYNIDDDKDKKKIQKTSTFIIDKEGKSQKSLYKFRTQMSLGEVQNNIKFNKNLMSKINMTEQRNNKEEVLTPMPYQYSKKHKQQEDSNSNRLSKNRGNSDKWDTESINNIMNNELVIGNIGEINKNTISPYGSTKHVTILGEDSIKSAVSKQSGLINIEKKQGLQKQLDFELKKHGFYGKVSVIKNLALRSQFELNQQNNQLEQEVNSSLKSSSILSSSNSSDSGPRGCCKINIKNLNDAEIDQNNDQSGSLCSLHIQNKNSSANQIPPKINLQQINAPSPSNSDCKAGQEKKPTSILKQSAPRLRFTTDQMTNQIEQIIEEEYDYSPNFSPESTVNVNNSFLAQSYKKRRQTIDPKVSELNQQTYLQEPPSTQIKGSILKKSSGSNNSNRSRSKQYNQEFSLNSSQDSQERKNQSPKKFVSFKNDTESSLRNLYEVRPSIGLLAASLNQSPMTTKAQLDLFKAHQIKSDIQDPQRMPSGSSFVIPDYSNPQIADDDSDDYGFGDYEKKALEQMKTTEESHLNINHQIVDYQNSYSSQNQLQSQQGNPHRISVPLQMNNQNEVMQISINQLPGLVIQVQTPHTQKNQEHKMPIVKLVSTGTQFVGSQKNNYANNVQYMSQSQQKSKYKTKEHRRTISLQDKQELTRQMPTQQNSPVMKLLKQNSPTHRRRLTNLQYPQTPVASMCYNQNNKSPNLQDNNSPKNNLQVPLSIAKTQRRKSLQEKNYQQIVKKNSHDRDGSNSGAGKSSKSKKKKGKYEALLDFVEEKETQYIKSRNEKQVNMYQVNNFYDSMKQN